MYISVTKWCIVGYGTGASWYLSDWSIGGGHFVKRVGTGARPPTENQGCHTDREKSYSLSKHYNFLHDIHFSCAINQPLLAHHWRVDQCLLKSRFIAPSIPWGVSAPGGKMLKQLLKDHNFLNNLPIFIIESSTFNIFAFQKTLHTIHFNLKSCLGFGERYLTP